MFFETERLPIVQQDDPGAPEAARLSAAGREGRRRKWSPLRATRRRPPRRRLAELQKQAVEPIRSTRRPWTSCCPSSRETSRASSGRWTGYPVIIRLIDPPLHEFLPDHDELLVEVTELRVKGEKARGARAQKEELLKAVEAMREANPMLGLRGCRLGILYPEIIEMQVRAIIEAACQAGQGRRRTSSPRS